MKRYQLIFSFLLFFLFISCSRQSHHEEKITIEPRSVSTSLFYSSVIEPLHIQVVTSPAEGVIVDMPFQYGDVVKKQQPLFTVSSTKFLTEYKSALMQYIKAKSEFNANQSELREAKFLHKNELISDDEMRTKQANFYASQLAFLQAKDALALLLQELDIKVNLYSLTIADIGKLTEAMHLDVNSENLRILSPTIGIVLSPTKSEEDNKKLAKGDTVKQGDVLAIIGDMAGVSIKIKVNELTINQLKLGQKVNVTGIAFPEYSLQGEVIKIDKQGESINSGLPTFLVEIAVKKLSLLEQKNIHVGMSAKVEIILQTQPQITIPITAVFEKNGATYVRRYDPTTKKIDDVSVKTGQTTADSVAILSSLNVGDQIVIPH